MKNYERVKKYLKNGDAKMIKRLKKEIKLYEKTNSLLKERMADVEKSLSSESTSNAYDTVAWSYYNLYLMDEDKSDLLKAVDYTKKAMQQKINNSKQQNLSRALQKTHLQEIVGETYASKIIRK